MDTETTPRSVGTDSVNYNLRSFEYNDYTWDGVWNRVEQMHDTKHALRDVHADHISELTVLIEFHQLYTGTGTM